MSVTPVSVQRAHFFSIGEQASDVCGRRLYRTLLQVVQVSVCCFDSWPLQGIEAEFAK